MTINLFHCLRSGFSTEVVFYTTGSLPQTSLPPLLVLAGPSWVTLQWTRPNSCSPEEVVTYTLEMQDETKVFLIPIIQLCFYYTVLIASYRRIRKGS